MLAHDALFGRAVEHFVGDSLNLGMFYAILYILDARPRTRNGIFGLT